MANARDLALVKESIDEFILGEEDENEEELPLEQELFFEQLNNTEDGLDLELDLEPENEDIAKSEEVISEDRAILEEFRFKRTPFPRNIARDIKERTTPNILPRQITPKQELFCRYFVSSVFKGDGFMAYCRAYNFEPITKHDYMRAKKHTSTLLNNRNISKRITKLLAEEGFSRADADVELAFTAKQRVDLGAKNKALDTYYKLTGAMKVQVEHSGEVKHKFLFPTNGREPQKLVSPEDTNDVGVEASWEELAEVG